MVGFFICCQPLPAAIIAAWPLFGRILYTANKEGAINAYCNRQGYCVMWLIEKLEAGLDLLLAGIAGAFVGLWMYTEIKTAKQKIYFTACGGLSSFYAAPYLAEYFHITGDGARTFFGFAIGIFGAAMLQAVKRAIDATDLWEVIKARFNIGKGGNT